MPMSEKPTFTPVKSSNIDALAHTSEGLYVRFKNSGVYLDKGVTAAEHEALVKAESIGAHFAGQIRRKYAGVPA